MGIGTQGRLVALAGLFTLAVGSPAWAACGDTEGDRIDWARERMFPTASKNQTEQVYQWLVNSTRSCNQSGDLWYYRSLTARKLGDAADAAYALRKADENNSKAKTEGFDPFASAAPVRVSSPDHIREKFALLVGIHKFSKSDSNLRFSAKDAQELGELLVTQEHFKKDNVQVLLDENATLENIHKGLGVIRAKAKPDDLVVVFISSHGVPRSLDPTGISYVMTSDFDSKDMSTQFSTGLKMVELAEFGRFMLANNYVLLLDTCYAGATQAGVNVGKGDGLEPLQSLQGSANRIVISASKADETSIEDDSTKHGLFTRFLLESLREKGTADLASVFQSVQAHVSEQAEKDHNEQHPVMLSFGQGSKIALGVPEQAASKSMVFPSLALANGGARFDYKEN